MPVHHGPSIHTGLTDIANDSLFILAQLDSFKDREVPYVRAPGKQDYGGDQK